MSQTNSLNSLMSREEMLRELELLPVWQLRQSMPTQLEAKNPVADESATLAQPQVDETQVAQQQVTPAIAIPAVETFMQQQAEVVEDIEEVQVHAPVSEPLLDLPLRILLSEDSRYAFLMAPDAIEADVRQMETLRQNMIRAMQVSCRVDVTDGVDKIFAVHTPKLIVCLGAEPANRLFAKTHNTETWRTTQQQEPLYYAQIPLIVTYDPAHLLANAADKALAWHDLCVAMTLMQSL